MGCIIALIVVFVILILGFEIWALAHNQDSSNVTRPPLGSNQAPLPEAAHESTSVSSQSTTTSDDTLESHEPSKPEPEAASPPNQLNDSFTFCLVVDEGSYMSGTNGLIVLVNNKDTHNPTYQELVNFLNEDKTDDFLYQPTPLLSGIFYGDPYDKVDKDFWLDVINGVRDHPFPSICADFAQLLHNNAEIAGIRAGYVCIDDHALNVFETTDAGKIFIDDTGRSTQAIPIYTPGSVIFGKLSSHDKVAYVEIGKPYGLISLEVAHLYGFGYEGYEAWVKKKALFDRKSDEYDSMLGGRTIVSEAEYLELNRRMDELIVLSDELGGFWELNDVVTHVGITWGDSN